MSRTNTVIREITKCLKKMKIIYLKLLTRSYIVYSSMQKDSKSTGIGILRWIRSSMSFPISACKRTINPLFCNPPALPSADCHCPICRSNATVPPPIGMTHSPADRLIIYKVDVTHINFLILNWLRLLICNLLYIAPIYGSLNFLNSVSLENILN